MTDFPSRVAAALARGSVQALPQWSFGSLAVDVSHRRWREAVGALRDKAGCTYFDWLGAVDEAADGVRVVVRLVALPEKPPGASALLVRTLLPVGRTRLDSLVPVFDGAGWHEREAAEMFGLQFVGGGDPAPLLLPEEFEGNPLRKDFVLASRVVTGWPGAKDPADGGAAPSRRRSRPPGVPAGDWGAAADEPRRSRRSSDSRAVTPPRGGRDG
jgi:NADH-quinone oxidoreductase subunit C